MQHTVTRTVYFVRRGLNKCKDFSVGDFSVTRGKYRNVVMLPPESVAVPRNNEAQLVRVDVYGYRTERRVLDGALCW